MNLAFNKQTDLQYVFHLMILNSTWLQVPKFFSRITTHCMYQLLWEKDRGLIEMDRSFRDKFPSTMES